LQADSFPLERVALLWCVDPSSPSALKHIEERMHAPGAACSVWEQLPAAGAYVRLSGGTSFHLYPDAMVTQIELIVREMDIRDTAWNRVNLSHRLCSLL